MLGLMAGVTSVILNLPGLMCKAEGIRFTQSAASLDQEALQSFIERDHNIVLEQSAFYQENRELFDNWEILQLRSEFFYLYQDKLNELFEENLQLF
jgi:hypothetical protein